MAHLLLLAQCSRSYLFFEGKLLYFTGCFIVVNFVVRVTGPAAAPVNFASTHGTVTADSREDDEAPNVAAPTEKDALLN